jgi:hypothetical protein
MAHLECVAADDITQDGELLQPFLWGYHEKEIDRIFACP